MTVPRTTTAWAAIAAVKANAAAMAKDRVRARVARRAAERRGADRNMGVAPPFPPRERGCVRGGTGLLAYRDADRAWCGRLPFPAIRGPVGAALARSSAFTPLGAGYMLRRIHSCGAVAEFHRASRTFRCGTGGGSAATRVRAAGLGRGFRGSRPGPGSNRSGPAIIRHRNRCNRSRHAERIADRDLLRAAELVQAAVCGAGPPRDELTCS